MMRQTRGQVSLESLVLLAGLFAFVAVLWAASLPLQDAAMRSAARISDESSFETLRTSVRLAAVSAPGFSLDQPWLLRQNVTLRWDSRVLEWSGLLSNRTLEGPFSSSLRLQLEPGAYFLRVRRASDGVDLGVV
ncbi:hypothetical protein HYV43_06890 [Candidatus Micrarchaeota archaeon]|nr:hypothetical protein [Candidatus Micrarchaeota archaeon]